LCKNTPTLILGFSMKPFNPLNYLKIRSKFTLFLVVPLSVVLFFSMLNIEQKYVQLKNIQATERYIAISLILADLVHELQKERGFSAAFLGSHKALFKAELSQQRLLTDNQLKQFSDSLSHFNLAESNDELKKVFLPVVEHLQLLADVRSKVNDGYPTNTFAYYSKGNATIITLIQFMQVVSDDNLLSRQSNAYSSLLWLQEYMGQERGSLSGVFAKNRITPALLLDVSAYIRNQEKSLRDFSVIGTAEQQRLLAENLHIH